MERSELCVSPKLHVVEESEDPADEYAAETHLQRGGYCFSADNVAQTGRGRGRTNSIDQRLVQTDCQPVTGGELAEGTKNVPNRVGVFKNDIAGCAENIEHRADATTGRCIAESPLCREHSIFEQRDEELIARSNEVVDGCDGDIGSFGDIDNDHLVRAHLRDELASGAQDCVATAD